MPLLSNLPEDHPYIPIYNQQRSVICVGLGPWELPDSTRWMADILYRKGIHTWVDFWGRPSKRSGRRKYRLAAWVAPRLHPKAKIPG